MILGKQKIKDVVYDKVALTGSSQAKTNICSHNLTFKVDEVVPLLVCMLADTWRMQQIC